MADRRQVMYDIERCICHVPDACRDCSHYGHGEVVLCMEELLNDVLTLLKEQQKLIDEITQRMALKENHNGTNGEAVARE